jgi:hypothetical protein
MPPLREFRPRLERELLLKLKFQRRLHCLGKVQMGQPCSWIHFGQGSSRQVKFRLKDLIEYNTGFEGLDCSSY